MPLVGQPDEVGEASGAFGVGVEFLGEAEIEVPFFGAGVEAGGEDLKVGGFVESGAGISLGGACLLEIDFYGAVGEGFP